MPKMSGIEAAIQIQELLPKCKVLLVSGDSDSSPLLQDALSRGYKFEILAMPVHPLALFRALRSFETHSGPVPGSFRSQSLEAGNPRAEVAGITSSSFAIRSKRICLTREQAIGSAAWFILRTMTS